MKHELYHWITSKRTINSRLISRLRPSRFSVRRRCSSGIFGRSEGFIQKYQRESSISSLTMSACSVCVCMCVHVHACLRVSVGIHVLQWCDGFNLPTVDLSKQYWYSKGKIILWHHEL